MSATSASALRPSASVRSLRAARAAAIAIPAVLVLAWAAAPASGPFGTGTYFGSLSVAAALALASLVWAGARRLAEESRSRERDALAREHAAAAASVRIDKLERELDEFLHSVSHDLRAPLRHVDAFSGLLRESLGERLDPTSASRLQSLLDAGARANRLIDALLVLSRTSRIPVEPGPVDMERLFAEERRALEPARDGRKVEWEVGPLAPVNGSEALLRVVWRNLLANALKYTAGRSEALIRVRSERREDGWVVTSVADNGIGFDPAGAHRLFGVFERLHAVESGVGTGLAEVRRAVERHGGEVSAVGEIDRGATFSFTLPAAEASPRRPAREEGTHP